MCYDNFIEKIVEEEDRELFMEAILCANSKSYRAAYIMTWICCAESLKRRLKIAGNSDSNAGKLYKEIEGKEAKHEAVDAILLQYAYKYGFLSDGEKTRLEHIYQDRCVFGHPYEQKPSDKQLLYAMDSVTEIVLSRPSVLGIGYLHQIIKKLATDVHFLPADDKIICDYADSNILNRITPNNKIVFFDIYFEEVNRLCEALSSEKLIHRGIIIIRHCLESMGCSINNNEKWHLVVSKNMEVGIRVFEANTLIQSIGNNAKTMIISKILELAIADAKYLRCLDVMIEQGSLTESEITEFNKIIGGYFVNISKLRRIDELIYNKISLKRTFEYIVYLLKSHDWYLQNDAIKLFSAYSVNDVAVLNAANQEILGRNVLQAAEGSANNVIAFIDELKNIDDKFPYDFYKGMLLECFCNEKGIFRYKVKHLSKVCKAIDILDDKVKEELKNDLIKGITTKKEIQFIFRSNFDIAEKSLSEYEWGKEIVDLLKNNKLCDSFVKED